MRQSEGVRGDYPKRRFQGLGDRQRALAMLDGLGVAPITLNALIMEQWSSASR
jgi:hypothetical protein